MNTSQIITIVVSLVGVLTVGLLVPVFLLSRTEKHRQEDIANADRLHREDRDAEWARQDEVAAKAAKAAEDLARNQQEIAGKSAETARLLLDRQNQIAEDLAGSQAKIAAQAAKAAELLVMTDKEAARTAKATNSKLDVIHTLVNSNMTAAIQSEYEAVTRELAMMREVIELKRAAGLAPIHEAIAAIEATENRLRELADTLADRAAAQDRAADELRATSALKILSDPPAAGMLDSQPDDNPGDPGNS